MTFRQLLNAALAACLIVSGAGGLPLPSWRSARAAEPKGAKPSSDASLDDELLKGLGESAEEERLGNIPRPSKSKTPAKRAAQAPTGPSPEKGNAKPGARPSPDNDLDEELLKGLGEGEDIDLGKPGDAAEGEGDDNPLAEVERKMREAGDRIAANQSDDVTQRLQNTIAADLEKLIKELQKRKKSSSSSSSSSQRQQQTAEREKIDQPEAAKAGGDQTASNDPAKDSSSVMSNRKTATPDAAQLEQALKDIWGQLPPHLRQQMEQYAKEELLPKYELQIEEYFRALAEGVKFKSQGSK